MPSLAFCTRLSRIALALFAVVIMLASCAGTPKEKAGDFVAPDRIDFGRIVWKKDAPNEQFARSFAIVSANGAPVIYGGHADWDGLPVEFHLTPGDTRGMDENWRRFPEVQAAATPDHARLVFAPPRVRGVFGKWPAEGKKYSGTLRLQVRTADTPKFTTVRIPVTMVVAKDW